MLKGELVSVRRLFPSDKGELLEKMNEPEYIRKNIPIRFTTEVEIENMIEREYIFAIEGKDGIIGLIKDEYYDEMAKSGIIRVWIFDGKKDELNEGIKLFVEFCRRIGSYDILYMFVPEFESTLTCVVEQNDFSVSGKLPNARMYNRKRWDVLIYSVELS